MKHHLSVISFVLCTLSLCTSSALGQTLDEVVLDIYTAVTEFGETDYEQLQSDLYALHDAPIDLNHTSQEELEQLPFLSPRQIDALLAYADRHPFESLYELRLLPELTDYDIRNLLPFVTIDTKDHQPSTIDNRKLSTINYQLSTINEFSTRLDARDIEGFSGTDPVYVQTRYRLDYGRRIIFGAQLRRPAGGEAQDLQYGAYLQLNDISPHLHTVVAGNYQASFGQGLVLAPVFHSGKSMYVASVGQQREGLRYYSSVDGQGLHGTGATLRWQWGKKTRLDFSALYSMKRANDSTWHHLIGTNLTLRHQRLQVELTAVQNIWSDSIRPYRNAAYNQHYFRGTHQAVIGASVRYNHGWFDIFGEVATAENYKRFKETINGEANKPINSPYWGFGTIIGSRFYPTDGVSLIALYRYYSPFFDNALGYAFSETSRLGDENGGYIGFDITRLSNWRFTGYADVFRFSGPKYGIPESPSLGFDVVAEAQYHSTITNHRSPITLTLRLRAKQKGESSTYSIRCAFDWQQGPLSLRTTAEANLVPQSKINNQLSTTYGFTVYQDIAFDCTPYTPHHTPLSLRLRLQGFDAREWNNRIYTYEHDVLYAFSIPATYGLGGRAYLCLRWQIIPQLALYFRVSETVYNQRWAASHSKQQTRTDLHLLLRARF